MTKDYSFSIRAVGIREISGNIPSLSTSRRRSLLVEVFGSGSIARFRDMLKIWLDNIDYSSAPELVEKPFHHADTPLNDLVLAESSNTLLVYPHSQTLHLGFERISVELGHASMDRRRDFPSRSLAIGRGGDGEVPHGIDRLLRHSEERCRLTKAEGVVDFESG